MGQEYKNTPLAVLSYIYEETWAKLLWGYHRNFLAQGKHSDEQENISEGCKKKKKGVKHMAHLYCKYQGLPKIPGKHTCQAKYRFYVYWGQFNTKMILLQ